MTKKMLQIDIINLKQQWLRALTREFKIMKTFANTI